MDWMSVAKVLLLAWKLRMKLSKKQVKTKGIWLREKLFPTIKKSHAWSVRLQHSNLESITKTKKEDVNDWTGKTHASYSGTRSCKTWGLSNTYSCLENLYQGWGRNSGNWIKLRILSGFSKRFGEFRWFHCCTEFFC